MDEPAGTAERLEGSEARSSSQSSTMTGSEPTSQPTTEQIAQRAYEIYQSRGGTEGQDVEDWLQAERELRRPQGRD